jgi:membrane associated rhomboid family serine protease
MIAGYLLIILNIVVSYRGIRSESFFDRYKLEVDYLLIHKDYKRLVTSGFLHVNWMHLFFNMLALYFFMGIIESSLGEIRFLIIYFSGLIGGSLLALYIHRNHADYSCVGASGATCGLIFAAIALFPGYHIGFFFLPISLPGWLFGILFVLVTINAIKYRATNVGNEAHLGGALLGMAAALLMEPAAFAENYIVILIIALPVLVFIYLVVAKPHILIVDNLFSSKDKDFYSIDQKYNVEKSKRQQEIDSILDKINRRGIKSLTKEEKEKLDQYSK